MRSFFFSAVLLLLTIPGLSPAQSPLDRLAVVVHTPSRAYSFTNKESAFLYGETNGRNTTSWQGFNVYGHEFLDDYTVTVDGKRMDRRLATTTVYPDFLVRTYPGGIIEEVRPCDSLAAFSVVWRFPRPVEVVVRPLFADAQNSRDYRIALGPASAALARTSHLSRTETDNYPCWIALVAPGCSPLIRDTVERGATSPILFAGNRSRVVTITFAVADDSLQALHDASYVSGSIARLSRQRRGRMEQILARTATTTKDHVFDKALAWARLSMDALIMHQGTEGIFAGLPWFDNYWGRDTFISLSGATLVNGEFSTAREILRSFADFQLRDSTSSDYGRIPNLVTTTDKAYNTADGTPRLIMMIREYAERSGDQRFLMEMYPVILRSIEGTLKYHCDDFGFLVHADADTWMDAVGSEGPWSPRGNRANDIQALWAQQLDAGIWCATRFGDVVSARRWHFVRERLEKNFHEKFFDDGVPADHLLRDGTKDFQLRPNQIFLAPLLSPNDRASVVRRVVTGLTYPWGVASLSPADPNFHPYHQTVGLYPKDAAYHNGTVWTWLQGALISELCRFDREDVAYRLTANASHQILDRGAVGTQSELLDALPRPGTHEPDISGTVSQAWNLAEYLRNFSDDYAGVRLTLLDSTFRVSPHIPAELGEIHTRVNIGATGLEVIETNGRIQFTTPRTLPPLTAVITLRGPDGISIRGEFRTAPTSTYRCEIDKGALRIHKDGGTARFVSSPVSLPKHESLTGDLPFLAPVLPRGLKALRGPDHPLMTHAQIKAVNSRAEHFIDAEDPPFDDTGTGEYRYMRNPAFVPGSFDLVRSTMTYDSLNAYFRLTFRALSDPGWHPEYGYQLTFAAIAIDMDGKPGSGTRIIPRNANVVLDSAVAYERLILVGGGVQVEDSKGNILAAYIPSPADAGNPLGDAPTGTISFAIPLKYLGQPNSHWTLTIVAGGQDDHGGAGIGEFRAVNRDGGEWVGGGKKSSSDPNVYDVLVARPTVR